SAAPGERVGPVVVAIEVINQRANRYEAFNIKIIKLDEEAEIANVNDHSVELFAQAFSHEDGFAPLINLVFGGVRGSFALARFFGDQFEGAVRNGRRGVARLFFR